MHLRLPREYDFLVGLEWATLSQVSPASEIDQWRVALMAGYASPPDVTEHVGWEASIRAGFLRGETGGVAPTGFQSGARFGFPLRLVDVQEPWRLDQPFLFSFLIVPEIGLDVLRPARQDWQLEPVALLSLRLYISSTLTP